MIGLGYIGLPTAAILASRGVDVIGVDINSQAVETINRGDVHIIEPGLDAVVKGVVQAGKLRASLKPEEAEAFIIAVPTPFREGFQPDLSYVQAAAESIAPFLRKGNLVILESTSPVGTTDQMTKWLQEARPDLTFPLEHGDEADIQIAYCPERVLPGKVLRELTENDRVIGGMSPNCTKKTVDLYKIFVDGQCLTTNARTAEMVKLTENSFRDVNIAFANELSMICDELGINVWELIPLANRHPRVSILQPGPGVGGHCISVDPWFIVDRSPKTAKLIRTAREVNDHKPQFVLEKIFQALSNFDTPQVACLGLAFKPNIDDLRESPALHIVEKLVKNTKAKITAVEPNVESLPKSLAGYDNVVLEEDIEAAIKKADIVVLLVDHKEFFQIDSSFLASKVVIDTRGILKS